MRIASLDSLYKTGKLSFSPSCSSLADPDSWASLKNRLYNTNWCPDIRETFNGFGNAIEYLGRYANRIAITNSRIKSVCGDSVTFIAKDYKNNSALKEATLSCCEFIRRFMMHVLPYEFSGLISNFMDIRYRRSEKYTLVIVHRWTNLLKTE